MRGDSLSGARLRCAHKAAPVAHGQQSPELDAIKFATASAAEEASVVFFALFFFLSVVVGAAFRPSYCSAAHTSRPERRTNGSSGLE